MTLSNVSVLITRPVGVATSMIDFFTDLGAEVLHAPVLEIQSLKDAPDCNVKELDTLIFVSQHAVMHSADLLGKVKNDTVDFLAVGPKTAALLETTYGVLAESPKTGIGGKALLASFPMDYWSHRQVGIVRGAGSPDDLPNELNALGVNVRPINVYQQHANPSAEKQIIEFLHAPPPPKAKLVTAFSSDSLSALEKVATEHYESLSQLPLLVISNSIAQRATALRWSGPIEIASGTSEQDLLAATNSLLP